MIYITMEELENPGLVGIKKKIFAQIESFKKVFGTVYYTEYCGHVMYLLCDGKILEKEAAVTGKERSDWIYSWITRYNIHKVYFRYWFAMADKWLLRMFEKLKNDDKRVILEFPTIPYDNEINNLRIKYKDAIYRELLKKYIDKCTVCAHYDSVFGIPSIPILNGVDINKQPAKTIRNADGTIVLLAVASMTKWHAYERVICGMGEYYRNGGEKEIVFRLVGDGPCLEEYKEVAQEYGIEDKVELRGRKEGHELDKEYDEADIAIGSLGMYKINLTYVAPIKLGEYSVRGIPFIYGYEDEGMRGDEEYAIKVSNDSSPIDMNVIIDFYARIQYNNGYRDVMREEGIKKYTWDSILEPVIHYYRDNSK